MATSTAGIIASTFDTGLDGWNIQGDVQSFTWQPTDGNPGGNLQWVDAATGAVSYWQAAPQFLGNDTLFYGGSLSYDIEDSGSDYSGVPDVELTGDGMTIVATLGQAGTTWTHYAISLDDTANWKVGDLSGATATEAQIRDVLGNLTQLLIRAEYVDGDENGGLDNVIMTTPAATSTKVWLDDNDSWATPADWTGDAVPLPSDKVVVAEGDPQITSPVTLSNSFGEAAGATVTLAGGSLNLNGAAALSGTINGTGALRTRGATTVNGATLAGTVTWGNSGTVTATGALTLGDSAARKATLNNGAGGTYNITGPGGIVLFGSTASVFNNAGLLERTVGTFTVAIGVKLVDTGTVTIATGGLEMDGAGTTFSGAITGAGTAAFGSSVGATLLAGSSLSVGTVSIVAGGRLNVGTSLSYGGKFLEAATGVLGLGASTLTLTSTATIAGSVGGNGGTLAVTGGNLVLNSGAALGMSTFALSNGATVTTNTALNTQAALSESASTLVLNQHSVTLAHGASFSGGTVDGAGGGTLAVKGTASLTGGLVLDGKVALALYGATTETGGLTLGDSVGGSATLLNASGAAFTIGDDSTIQAPVGGTGKISNAGTLTKSGTSGTSLIGPRVTNTGTIAVATGTLNLAGGVLGAGALTIGSGTTLELGGPTSAGTTVSFASGGGSGETLQLDKAQAFTGKIAGFGTGEAMDLTNIAFGGATLSYADTSSGGTSSGTLTVKSGGTTANLHLLGSYTVASFTPVAPDSGATPGTLITFHA